MMTLHFPGPLTYVRCLLVLFTIGLIALLSACENDIKTVNTLLAADTLPLEAARSVKIIYSDSASVQIILNSPELKRYGGKEPYIDFPKGVKVIFYDDGMVEKSELTCQWARIWEKTKLMEARNKVEVVNRQKHEKLSTEHLLWDEKKAIIYSPEFVKITTQDKVLYGQGFESDQRFERWIIKKPTGSFTLDKEE